MHKAQFDQDGYLLIRDVLSSEASQGVLTSLCSLGNLPGENWEDPQLHQALTDLRESDPRAFGSLYDKIRLTLPLQDFVQLPVLRSLVADITGRSINNFTTSGHMLRLDAPGDSRNRLDWHQETGYYPQNPSGEGCVLWMPLTPCHPDNGTVELIPGSHHGGTRPSADDANEEGRSQQFAIAVTPDDKAKALSITAHPGDAAFFHMQLVHRSGFNASTQFRITCGVRFHDLSAPDFASGYMDYIVR